jgi:hypothetical protein
MRHGAFAWIRLPVVSFLFCMALPARAQLVPIPLGQEFRVNTYTTLEQFFPTVTGNLAGDFVVAWHSYTQDGSNYGVFAQRYSSSGAAQDTEFQFNDFVNGFQRFPVASSDDDGAFVIAWNDNNAVTARVYSSSGVAVGTPFPVNDVAANGYLSTARAGDGQGFAVVWETVSSNLDVRARRLSPLARATATRASPGLPSCSASCCSGCCPGAPSAARPRPLGRDGPVEQDGSSD